MAFSQLPSEMDIREINNNLQEISLTFSRIETLLRLFAQTTLDIQLSSIFTNRDEMVVYELTNGIRSTREIAIVVGKSHNWVADLWKGWGGKNSIVEVSAPRKPYKAKYTLPELAIIRGGRANLNDSN